MPPSAGLPTLPDMGNPGHPGVRGILAPATGLGRWLSVVMVVLLAGCALRYLDRHGTDPTGVAVLAGALLLAVAYASRGYGPHAGWWPPAWVGSVVLLWAVLTLTAPSFAWTAVPLAFAALEVLTFARAVAVVVLMTAVVGVATLRISDGFDPTLVAGPVGIGLVTVLAYRALEREARTRQQLLDELTAAQDELVTTQRRAGALTERTRLSREIHDSVGQGLSSINLLLNAADADWGRRPDVAREHVRTAAATARDGLDDVRRVVRDLAPTAADAGGEDEDPLGTALHTVLERSTVGIDAGLRLEGTARPVPPDVAGALVQTTRGALANVLEHARATRVVVTLTYLPGEVILDVRDDGRGFDPEAPTRRGTRGHGLPGIRDRAAALGGRVTVESAPGEGTSVSVALPTDRDR